MLILIAESKTMTPCDAPVAAERYLSHKPMFEADADAIVSSLDAIDARGLASAVRISDTMARRLKCQIYEFENKLAGATAIEAFTGVVFKALSFDTLGQRAREQVFANVRIISSLYGLLRPDDIVKAYRFDFTTRLAPGYISFARFWRDRVTDAILSELTARGEHEVLDLLPTDAAACVDMKRVAEIADVRKVKFCQVQPGGGYKTPNAGLLKKLRGTLLRQIVTVPVDNFAALETLTGDAYYASLESSDQQSVIFYTV